MVAQKQQRT